MLLYSLSWLQRVLRRHKKRQGLYDSQETLVEETGAKIVLGREEGKGWHILQMTSIFTLVKLTLYSALISKLWSQSFYFLIGTGIVLYLKNCFLFLFLFFFSPPPSITFKQLGAERLKKKALLMGNCETLYMVLGQARG